ncbi:ribosome biogenesis GTPase RsgA, partial [Sodalis-like symbiont of Bactericera trigonica]
WHLAPERIARGFIEFREYLGICKFRDCRHDTDPGCAIRGAVERGAIARERFDNYHRILDSMAQVNASKSF